MNNNTLYILHGSRTGNSKAVAELAHAYANYHGIPSICESMDDFSEETFKNAKIMLIAVSTHGEGDPPVQAEAFYEYIHQADHADFSAKKIAVLALGDSSYRHFCKTGMDIEKRLKEFGSTSFYPIVKCDIDFEEPSKQWVKDTIDKIKPEFEIQEKDKKNKEFVFELKLDDQNKYNAYNAEILEKKQLNQGSQEKRTYHLTLSLKNSDIDFMPGDSIGVYCPNSKLFVDQIIKTLGFDPTYPIETESGLVLLKEALVRDYELTMLTPVVVRKYADIIKNRSLNTMLADKETLQAYVNENDILDLITDFPAQITPVEFVSILRKLSPRLYSVASSNIISKDTVDLTVGIIEFDTPSRTHIGVGSSFISERIELGERIPVFLEPNEKFRLPGNSDIPIIMISTGTGIAPFRAFLQERKLKVPDSKNWLFFGDRYAKYDFLYQSDIEKFKQDGILTRLDTAFSRDNQHKKKYITHKMLDNKQEFFEWIQKGAVVYVCGNKRTMAESVRKTMIEIIASEGNMQEKNAVEYFHGMKSRNQYLEDIY